MSRTFQKFKPVISLVRDLDRHLFMKLFIARFHVKNGNSIKVQNILKEFFEVFKMIFLKKLLIIVDP